MLARPLPSRRPPMPSELRQPWPLPGTLALPHGHGVPLPSPKQYAASGGPPPSCTKMSGWRFVSFATKFVASLSKATTCPSAEIEEKYDVSLPSTPFESTLARLVVPACKSRTNTFEAAVVPPGIRFVESLKNETNLPLAEIEEPPAPPFPCAPPESRLTSVVCPVCRSCTNTSSMPFASPATRFGAKLSKP